ncbi:MAG: NifB/NifX family molybdenum-iron cluster-binding protein [Bacillota bacterium]
MRIAVASEGSVVAQHFGRCPEYTIFEVRDGTVAGKTVIPNPGHQPGFLPVYLGDMGVSCIIAGGMGPRAQGLFERRGIRAVVGVEGPVDGAVSAFLRGDLVPGESFCDHPHGGGECDALG